MTDKAQEIADGLRNYIAEPRRAELAGDIREALEAKEAECERLRKALKPFADLAEELYEEAHNARQVGGYIPLEADMEVYSVKNGDLFRARAARPAVAVSKARCRSRAGTNRF